MSEPSIFTRILKGEIPSQILYEDERCFAIRDIAPKAPTHLLLIPKEEIPRLVDAQPGHRDLLGHLLLVAGNLAREYGIEDGFRLVINNGTGGGQTVFHLHLHLLGNKKFSEAELDV